MIGIQVIALLLLVPIMTGPVGHYLALDSAGPDLVVVAAWAFSWFGDRQLGWRWAIMAGLTLDLLTYLPLGSWTLSLILIVVTTDWLKTRFLEASSLTQALLTLSLASLISQLVLVIITKTFDYQIILISLGENLIFGTIIFYILAIKFQLFWRWTGRRL